MIKISKVKADLANSKRYLEENASDMKKGQVSSHKKKIAFLSLIHNYLKSDPDLKFITSEVSRLAKREKVIYAGYEVWSETPNTKQFKNDKDKLKFYQKENGIPKIKTQLKALRFILNQ